ncbi:hypothetical protein EC968_001785 [Mortierella alpina]|nr:hypothetical protein EC968_001785 [Mortierella alpina]
MSPPMLRAQLNPIVYIPPTVLVLAIIGILSFRYLDAIQFQWQDLRSRLRGGNTGDAGLEDFEEDDELLLDLEFDENGEPILVEDEGGHHQGEVDVATHMGPQGSTTTSSRLRMHHEMVQQMRARAGFAPEPFPGDVEDGQGGDGDGEGDEDEDERGEDDGGVGSSTGIRGTTTTARIKRIGKKKAERLQRREQMRAYHEFMEMQRAERRQQEEMFKMQDAVQQEERQRKRAEQLERDRKRKEQLKQKEAKDTESRLKRIQTEKLKEEKARRELRAYIQRVRSFQLPDLAQRLGRTEAQLLTDLAAIAAETDLLAGHAPSMDISTVPRISLASNMTALTSTPLSSLSSSSSQPLRPHLLVLRDPATDRYLILEQAQLESFAQVVKEQGRISKKELSTASKTIFQMGSSSPSPSSHAINKLE